MPAKKGRVFNPPTDEQVNQLNELLSLVDTHTVVTYDWGSPGGRKFLTAVRDLQLSNNVATRYVAEALGLSYGTLAGAITHYYGEAARQRRARQRAKDKQG